MRFLCIVNKLRCFFDEIFIGYSCGCGDEYEVIEAKNENDAMHYAYECAIDNYHSFEGYHGILNWNDVKEEYGLEDNYKVDNAYVEEIEKNYMDELIGFTVNWISDDLIFISEETYNRMLRGEL